MTNTNSRTVKAVLVSRGYAPQDNGSLHVKTRYTGAKTTVEINEDFYSTTVTRKVYTTKGFLISETSQSTYQTPIEDILASMH